MKMEKVSLDVGLDEVVVAELVGCVRGGEGETQKTCFSAGYT